VELAFSPGDHLGRSSPDVQNQAQAAIWLQVRRRPQIRQAAFLLACQEFRFDADYS
jgi:hypothetical protein